MQHVPSLAERTPCSTCGTHWPVAQISTCVDTLCFQLLEFVVCIYNVDLETAVSENSEDLFDAIDDVFGSSFMRCVECFLLAFADAVKTLDRLEFDLG